MSRGRYGTSMHLVQGKPRTMKAKHHLWCRKCRKDIKRGEWVRLNHAWAEHTKCPP